MILEVRVVCIPRHDRTGGLINLGDDEPPLTVPWRTEHPLHVPEHTETSSVVGRVLQRQKRQFHRIVRRDTYGHILLEAVHGVLKARDTGTVPNDPAS
jgi:hypothetical protein